MFDIRRVFNNVNVSDRWYADQGLAGRLCSLFNKRKQKIGNNNLNLKAYDYEKGQHD